MSFKNFSNDHQVMNLNRHNITVVNIDGVAASENNVILVVPYNMPDGYKGIKLEDVIIVSDTATTESDVDKNYSFQVANLTTTETLLSTPVGTFTTAEIAIDTPYRVTPDQNNSNLSTGEVLELQITKLNSPTDLTNAKIKAIAVWSWEV